VALWFITRQVVVAMMGYTFTDEVGSKTLSCKTENNTNGELVVQLQFRENNRTVWEKTLHEVDAAFVNGTMVRLMQGTEIVRRAPVDRMHIHTFADADGTAAFSINFGDKQFHLDGLAVTGQAVYHVYVDKHLHVSNHSDEFGICTGADAKGGNDRRLAVQRWTDCYDGDEVTRTFSIGIAVGSGLFSRRFNNDETALAQWVNSVVSSTNMIFKQQLNIAIKVADLVIQGTSQGGPSWDAPQCHLDILSQLSEFRNWQQPSKLGLWHLLDDCFGKSGNTIGIATQLAANPPGTICMMDRVPGYNTFFNTAVSWYSHDTWKTFAHELGHNFGAHHSFEEGQGRTGGIMDYGDGKLNGEYQFNTKYRKDQVCASIQKVIGTCSAFAPLEKSETSPVDMVVLHLKTL
jgi:hypothetical protein